ncbi:TetR/AcrR family transcriptional regulator [Rhizobiaceae bacterium BDR2-2]|uniref:TetR/AcrR family transcriptional regulator n=1 Tax=Ectorhizobium quercum TaxID=2965071 RepID=A0AAE3MWU9_9HYPH|nr:TetR/AcrR family transcriptional regulator [Ectorhizobium quercum]MCX8995579.1 TetR/AcrR family transcriptional regulator [Ectorhizobium quercum]
MLSGGMMASASDGKATETGAARPGKGLFRNEASERYQEILEAAAALFAERGYAATSVRDIGERVGLLGGSLYHYIKSKEALFVKIHDTALDVAAERLEEAISGVTDPWEKLEAACVRMLEIQLDPHSITMPLMNDFQSTPLEVRERLVARRDVFEQTFRDLVDDLPLDPALDRGIYRLLLLTLLNNISGWYRQGRLTPAEIGRQIVLVFRHQAGG